MIQIPPDELDRFYIGLNRVNFIDEILNPIFGGNFRQCAEAMELRPNYLRDIIMSPTRDAGTKTLSAIYRYCVRKGLNPERFIFVLK